MTTCIFCGDTDSPLSKEDAWPKWLNALLQIPDGKTAGLVIQGAGEQRHEKPGMTRIHPSITKKVCRVCNNGWMAKLEGKVKPILEPLVRGEARLLSEADQRLLARWAIKTAMVLQHTIPGETGFPPIDVYRWVMENDEPPVRHRVYIADTFGENHVRWNGTKAIHVGTDHGPPNAFVTMLVAGSVAFQVIADFRDPRRGGITPIALALFDRIWPVRRPLQWPSAKFPGDMIYMLSESAAVYIEEQSDALVWKPSDNPRNPFTSAAKT